MSWGDGEGRKVIRVRSVPAERVLGRNGCRDELRPARVAHAALSAAVAVAFARWHGAIAAGEVAAEEGAAHERRAAASGSLAHLGRAADGARPPVRLLLALVTPRNDKHDNAVRRSHRHRAADNARGGAPLGVGLAARIAAVGAEGVVAGTTAARVTTIGARAGASAARPTPGAGSTGIDGNRGVDLLREVIDDLRRIVVQSRVGQLDIYRQRLHHAPGVHHFRDRGDVAQRILRIYGTQSSNLDHVGIKLATVGQSFRQEFEYLCCSLVT